MMRILVLVIWLGLVVGSFPAYGEEIPPIEARLAAVPVASELPRAAWRGLTSIDPRYVLDSSLESSRRDPSTGGTEAVYGVLIGWRDAATGFLTALGRLEVALAADGTLLRDVYRGPRPAGPPPGTSRAMAAPAVPQTPDPCAPAYDPGEPLESYAKLGNTAFRDPCTGGACKKERLYDGEDCAVLIEPTGDANFGLKATYDLPVSTASLSIDVRLRYSLSETVWIKLKNHTTGSFDVVATYVSDGSWIEDTISVSPAASYVDAEGKVVVKVVFEYSDSFFPAGNVPPESDIDEVDM